MAGATSAAKQRRSSSSSSRATKARSLARSRAAASAETSSSRSAGAASSPPVPGAGSTRSTDRTTGDNRSGYTNARLALFLAVAGLPAMVTAPLAAATEAVEDAVELTVEIDGRDVAAAGSGDPLRLDPNRPVEVGITVENRSRRPVVVGSVRVEGRALGLTFFSYETLLDIAVAAGTAERRSFPLRLRGLDGQATGLLPARVALIDNDGAVLAEVPFTADVRGSLRSVYGLFGLAVLCFTGLTVAATLLRLARGRLPVNRFRRAGSFALAGAGLGLSLTFGLSALRVAAPRGGVWLTLLLVSSAVAFALGYLTPHPESVAPEAGPVAAPDSASTTPTTPTTTSATSPTLVDTGAREAAPEEPPGPAAPPTLVP